MGRKHKGRYNSAGACATCGWDLDKFGQCTNVECETLNDDDEENE